MVSANEDSDRDAKTDVANKKGVWGNFKADVFERPAVSSVAGWIIVGFLTLIIVLSIAYAKHDGSGDAQVISQYWAWVTIAAVSIGALTIGWQPIFRRQLERNRSRTALTLAVLTGCVAALAGVALGDRLPEVQQAEDASIPERARVVASLLCGAGGLTIGFFLTWIGVRTAPAAGRRLGAMPRWRREAMLFPVKWPSWVFSTIDWALARGFGGRIAGTRLTDIRHRYLVLAGHLIFAALVGYFAPAPYGFIGVGWGLAVVFGVVRRWGWIEEDRAQFMMRRTAAGATRIGFMQDLRDEALTALTALFVLVAIGLRHLDQQFLWFHETPTEIPGLMAWMGFFGGELAKAVPLVDWSEVYGVANRSSIHPVTAAGKSTVFTMRATLDLVLIGAVVQAVQIATRGAEQALAWRDKKIDILDPFEERARFLELAVTVPRLERTPINPVALPAVVDFNSYDRGRLEEVIAFNGAAEDATSPIEIDPDARRAVALLLARYADEAAAKALAARAGALLKPEERLRVALLGLGAHPHADLLSPLADLAGGLAPDAPADLVYTIAQALARLEDNGAVVNRFVADLRSPIEVMFATGLDDAPAHFARFEAGEAFWMGSPDDDTMGRDNERERHTVTFAKPFAIARFPVTFDEYDAYCVATGAARPGDQGWGRGRRPAINVSHEDAEAYCAWLSALTGKEYRLPSEAEWEYACRGVKELDAPYQRWSFGDDESLLGDYAWFMGNSGGQTHPVGEKRPSPFGLHDMHGNVWEWCADVWHEDYDGAPEDGRAWLTGGQQSARVLRGGSWDFYPQLLRSAYRVRVNAVIRSNYFGFRLARTVSR